MYIVFISLSKNYIFKKISIPINVKLIMSTNIYLQNNLCSMGFSKISQLILPTKQLPFIKILTNILKTVK